MSKNKLDFEDFKEALFKKDNAYTAYRTSELQSMYDNGHALSFKDHSSPAALGAADSDSATGVPTQKIEKLLQTIISNQQRQLQTLVAIRWGLAGFAVWFVIEFILLKNR